ncbi:hypothetical protein [Kitasatospora griseola]|uniref:hypothetical protein n=1 Tax=Kitasatospora griseola TaxID=2064 RepID=UPI0016710F32|nr:hypothetical protein [Kitasatospora griseola]GGQ86764.1 hypothetical protein GCM10010195_48030 [Kitasatospora griseola]
MPRRPSRPRRPRRISGLLVLPLLLTAGCAGATAAPEPVEKASQSPLPMPTVGVAPVTDSANALPLPLDGYLLNPAQLASVQQAQAKLIDGCMAGLGLDFRYPPAPKDLRDPDAPTSRIDGRYGRQDAQLSARWGYHPEGGVPADRANAKMPEQSPEVRVAATGSDQLKVHFGPGGQIINGHKVPEHGCVGQANRRLTGTPDGLIGDPQSMGDTKFRTLDAAREHPRTQAAFAQWAACMKERGVTGYADPIAAMSDPEWNRTPEPGERELKVAGADADCRHRTNVVGIWYSVDFAYQQEVLDADPAGMAQVKAGLETQVRSAAEVLGG